MKSLNLISFVLLIIVATGCKEARKEIITSNNEVRIIPQPNKIEIGNERFTISAETHLVISDENKAIGNLLEEKLGFKLKARYNL